MGFALALAARFLSRRPASALLIGEGFAAQEAGALYGPGLIAHGLPLSRLVFVKAPDAALAFWAMEEALKCGAPAAVVGEIWNLKGYSLAASRRLLLAARKGRTPALLILASAYGQAERLSSAAETRFEIAAAPSAKPKAAAGRDLPGPFACGARLVKARLARAGPEGPLQAFDAERVIRLEWRSQDNAFRGIGFWRSGDFSPCGCRGWRRTARGVSMALTKRAPLAAVAKVNNAERLVCVDAEAARLGLTIGLSARRRARASPEPRRGRGAACGRGAAARAPLRLVLALHPARRARWRATG